MADMTTTKTTEATKIKDCKTVVKSDRNQRQPDQKKVYESSHMQIRNAAKTLDKQQQQVQHEQQLKQAQQMQQMQQMQQEEIEQQWQNLQQKTNSLYTVLGISDQQMELSQIELIYCAEGNANLVLALPQFKKVLRLPKMQLLSNGSNTGNKTDDTMRHINKESAATQAQTSTKITKKTSTTTSTAATKVSAMNMSATSVKSTLSQTVMQQLDKPLTTADFPKQQQQQQQPKQQLPQNSSASVITSPAVTNTTAVAVHQNAKVLDLKMTDFPAYIEILQCLVGGEFICKADVVQINKRTDKQWINDFIRPQRPAHRLDKEFCGQFGLLLPDATQLATNIDALLANLQQHEQHKQKVKAEEQQKQGKQKLIQQTEVAAAAATLTGDVYAIEIKPKQGWLLPSDVNNLFDLKPTMVPVNDNTICAKAKEEEETLVLAKDVGDKEPAAKRAKTNTRCRYCAMQFLKLQQRKINKHSEYCPLELFSGQPNRMLAALQSLFVCPQNNLRVFLNGNLIYGDHATTLSWKDLTEQIFKADAMQLMKHLLVTCLLRDFSNEVAENFEAAVDQPHSRSATIKAKNVAVKSKTVEKKDMVEESLVTLTNTNTSQATTTTTTVSDKKTCNTNLPLAATVAAAVAAESTSTFMVTRPQHISQIKPKLQTKTKTKAKSKPNAKTKRKSLITTTPTTTTTTTTIVNVTAMETTEIDKIKETMPSTETKATQIQYTSGELQHLPKNCILKKLLQLQLLLKHNLSYMSKSHYTKYQENTYNILKALLKKFHTHKNFSFEMLTPEEAYMIGATANDCSIMIAFQEIAVTTKRLLLHKNIVHLPEYNKTFCVKVSLLDLDPKPDSHISKYLKRTVDIERILQEQS